MAKVWKLLVFRGAEHNGKGLKALSIHCFWGYSTAFSQNTFLLRKWLSFVPRAPEIPTSNISGGVIHQWQIFESSSFPHFCDTAQHFLKTCGTLESGLLLFLELQKSLPVTFQGCWTEMAKVSIALSLQGCWTHLAKDWKLSHLALMGYPTAFSQNTFCLSKVADFCS